MSQQAATTRKASNFGGKEILADGAIVLRVHVGREWVNVQAVKNGRPIRRRYRLDKLVPIIGTYA